MIRRALLLLLLAGWPLETILLGYPDVVRAQNDGPGHGFVNWESPHVHPLDRTPNGELLLAVNTPDNRLEVFDLLNGIPRLLGSIPVGLDPVSVRARSDTEAWVVNHISDSVAVVDLQTFTVRRTLSTLDEPADVVFAGSAGRAFVSCSQADAIQIFDPHDLDQPAVVLTLGAEDPRALAVSPNGETVYVAVFQSGNATTVLAGGSGVSGVNPVSHPSGPYQGQNPPPNRGGAFSPPRKPEYEPGGSDPAPQKALIVRRHADGRWLDDNDGDWSTFVDGAQASLSLRPPGWQLADRDLASIDADSLTVEWTGGLLNTVMALAVDPVDGAVSMVGTEATNEIRFEPNLKGRFLRVLFARIPRATTTTPPPAGIDLNGEHLDYTAAQVEEQAGPNADPEIRRRSVGDPRAIVWTADGTTGWVAGLGSNNLVSIERTGRRTRGVDGAAASLPIEVGQGPTGLVVDDGLGLLWVLERFDGTLSVVDTSSRQRVATVPFFDPTPEVIRAGRPFLYDTRRTSGLGHVSCGSCHIDTRFDRLAWDLGDPQGDVKPLNAIAGQHNLGMNLPILSGGFEPFHPMKGPMVTQTLQAIIGMEPLHWRGDRDGLEEFNGAFVSLLGNDRKLTPQEMQRFESFLATLTLPPNPYRNLDNTLPTELALPGHFADGRFESTGGLAAGAALPPGNARAGLDLFRPPNLLDLGVPCVQCHSLPTGAGADVTFDDNSLQLLSLPPGPNGEAHLALSSRDASSNRTLKVPHLRNLYEKVGLDLQHVNASRSGFGFIHDGSVDSIARFVALATFQFSSDQEIADMVAFMLAFSGSDLPQGSSDATLHEPPGPPSQDTHAAVGAQLTVTESNRELLPTVQRLAQFVDLAEGGAVSLIAKARKNGRQRGWYYLGNGEMQSDRATQRSGVTQLRQQVVLGEELTFTVVARGTEIRLGVDRDRDGAFDFDELLGCGDPTDASVGADVSCLFVDGFETRDTTAWSFTLGGPSPILEARPGASRPRGASPLFLRPRSAHRPRERARGGSTPLPRLSGLQ